MSEDQEIHGSFPTGLVVGFLAGAVGYFVTQTNEGKKIKDDFLEHWHDLKDDLIANGVISQTEPEITDYIAALRNKISEFLGEQAESIGLYDSKSKQSTKKTNKRTKKKKFFSGI